MELKVWVDGIQRVVCGVTDTSTCQDVVYALAHATGQTGRFTLVEKWRNSERLLAPHEHPLKVLTKWGEYANDVHFVMRRSQNEANKALNQSNNNKNNSSSSNGGNNNQYVQNNKRQHDFLHIFPSNGGPNQKPSTNSKEIKKSLTFSCGHATSGSISSENSAPIVSNNNPQPKVDPPLPAANTSVIKSRDGKSRQDLPKGVVKGIPQKQRENSNNSAGRTDRPKHPPPYDEAVSRSSGRFAPSHLSLASPTPTVFPDEDSPSTKRRLITTTSKNETVSSEQSNMLDTTTTTQPYNRQLNNKSYHQNSRDSPTKSPECIISRGVLPTTTTTTSNHREKSPVKSIEKIPTSPQSSLIEDNPSSKSKQALVGRFENDKQISHTKLPSKGLSDKVTDDSGHDPQYQDLLCLVSLQREKLKNQQTELKQYDDEIVYWESRLHEQEEKLRVLQEELSHLERTQRDQDGELVELDRRPFNEEVELGKQEERTLRSELTLARSQLANCETELLQCHQRIRLLLEEITEERRLQSLREEREKKELEEQEQLLQEQLEALQQQLKEKTDESENQKSATDQVKEELQELESMFSLKQKEMETLMEEIRDANLYSLSLIPTDEGKFVTEGNFNNRPGSTRKIIGSPRQLENAVPTNKNPHGVWV